MASTYYDWVNKDSSDKADRLIKRAETDSTIGWLLTVATRMEGSYDAGFEAGVLAAENGLGRYDG